MYDKNNNNYNNINKYFSFTDGNNLQIIQITLNKTEKINEVKSQVKNLCKLEVSLPLTLNLFST